MAENQWLKERIFFSGDDYYSAITDDIKNAQTSIEVESYIFEYDEIGKGFVDSLIAAVIRGVRVRVIVDGIGSVYSVSTLQKLFREGGVEFKVFHPILGSWFIPVFRTINRRNHRKIWIIDKKAAYIGSYNISRVHTNLIPEPWRDSGLRVEGDDVKLLNDSFERIWSKNKFWKKKLFYFEDSINSPLVRLNDGKNKRRAYYRELLFRIREAKGYICFANAYFAPHFRLIMELCYSARRGVDVHLVVPRKSDVFFMPWVGATYYYALLQSGVKIHEYLPSFFHAKNYVIDDWMLIGSSNLNYRSLFHDLEVDLRVTSPENRSLFLKEINFDIENSEDVTFASFKKISWFRQKAAQFFLLFKSWM
jgi:cardiolipin synthase A/B